MVGQTPITPQHHIITMASKWSRPLVTIDLTNHNYLLEIFHLETLQEIARSFSQQKHLPTTHPIISQLVIQWAKDKTASYNNKLIRPVFHHLYLKNKIASFLEPTPHQYIWQQMDKNSHYRKDLVQRLKIKKDRQAHYSKLQKVIPEFHKKNRAKRLGILLDALSIYGLREIPPNSRYCAAFINNSTDDSAQEVAATMQLSNVYFKHFVGGNFRADMHYIHKEMKHYVKKLGWSWEICVPYYTDKMRKAIKANKYPEVYIPLTNSKEELESYLTLSLFYLELIKQHPVLVVTFQSEMPRQLRKARIRATKTSWQDAVEYYKKKIQQKNNNR